MIQSIFLGIFGMGGEEMILILIVVLLMFGGKKIPELMKGLGKGIKEFKDASKGVDGEQHSIEKKEESKLAPHDGSYSGQLCTQLSRGTKYASVSCE